MCVRACERACVSAAACSPRLGQVCPALALPPLLNAPQDLFKRVTSLSYLGDVRMGLAEDSRKVERIVAGSGHHFDALYAPLLQVRAWVAMQRRARRRARRAHTDAHAR